jgi:scavenger receptor class B, member 1
LISDLPIAISQPHFFNADPSLLNEVEGMKPEREKHQTILDVQPVKKVKGI